MEDAKKKKMTAYTKQAMITYGMVIAVYIICEICIHTGNMSNQMKGLLVPLCYYAIMAVSLNLTVGILGELSLGHAGFSCIGVFVGAVFSICMKDVITVSYLRFFLAILLGALAAGVIGFLIGIPVLRLRGDYLAIVTLAFCEIIKNVVNIIYLGKDSNGLHFSTKDMMSLGMEEGAIEIVKGPQGISGMPSDANFTIGVLLLLITLFVVLNLTHSRDGRAIMAIRDNLIAAESVGINITKYKLMAFSISAALAGAAGVLYAHNISIVKAATNNFGYNMSILILVFVVLGGIGNIRGSIIAAVILTLVPEMLRGLQQYRLLIYSVVLIGMMLLNWSPKAIEWKAGMIAKLKKGRDRKQTEKQAD